MDDLYDPGMATIADLLPQDTIAYLEDDTMDIHTWFSLTYSNYLVLNRAVLQSMPMDWQHRFTRLLRMLETVTECAGVKCASDFDVQAVEIASAYDDDGEYVQTRTPVPDPVPHYNRGREVLDLRPRP